MPGHRTPIDYRKAPFPWFGGKSRAAHLVWQALGDVAHYVEPFFGSGAVLLRRPHLANRAHYSETINDLDCFVANFWRAIQFAPQETARHAAWPVSEADLHARHIALLDWRLNGGAERVMGSWDFYDARIAGWWAWGVSCWIGSGFVSGDGPWTRDPHTGRIVRREGGDAATEHTGQKLTGQGISRRKPLLGNNGQGCNRPALREPGISRPKPHLTCGGQGCNHPALREPGISRQKPHLTDNGTGDIHAGLCEHNERGDESYKDPPDPAVEDMIEADYLETGGYHPIVMPEMRRWFAWLAARLRHTRVLCGDWSRCVTTAVLKTLSVRKEGGVCGIFLDPPYARSMRDPCLYAVESDPAADVRAWCLRHGDDPQLRIVLAGFDTEHQELEQHGWRCVEWFQDGWLTGGYGNIRGRGAHQQHRERLWLSPHCLPVATEPKVWAEQPNLFSLALASNE